MQIEINRKFTKAKTDVRFGACIISVTPPINEDYFIARVPLYKDQAIVVFPKFFTIGCGFAQEEDWNTNLPITTEAEDIYEHIKHNKKYDEISDQMCLDAIRLLQDWCSEFKRKNVQQTNPSS